MSSLLRIFKSYWLFLWWINVATVGVVQSGMCTVWVIIFILEQTGNFSFTYVCVGAQKVTKCRRPTAVLYVLQLFWFQSAAVYVEG
jgi:hypothetical protein